MKHTTSKWNIEKVYTKGQQTGLAVHPCHFYFEGVVDENVEADARLIAATPELLAALKVCLRRLECVEEPGHGLSIREFIREIITKIEGDAYYET